MALACLEAVKPCFNAVVKLRPTPRSPRRGERMRLQFAARSAAAHGVDCTWLLLRRRVRSIDGLATDNHDQADEQRKEEVRAVCGKRHPPLSRHHAVALGIHGARFAEKGCERGGENLPPDARERLKKALGEFK